MARRALALASACALAFGCGGDRRDPEIKTRSADGGEGGGQPGEELEQGAALAVLGGVQRAGERVERVEAAGFAHSRPAVGGARRMGGFADGEGVVNHLGQQRVGQRGRREHPEGLRLAVARQGLNAGEQGAASVVRQFAQQGQVQNLAVEDEGTVTDIDTVQDLERAERILAMRQTA